jgi:hypothetical protein
MGSTDKAYASCPTSIVNAPIETVWGLLTLPEQWGEFYDLRVLSVDPPGPATVGQVLVAESGPRLLHLKLRFRFTKIDDRNYELGFDGQLPLGVAVRQDLRCIRLGPAQCRVNYGCHFGFPDGWRGRAVRFLSGHGFDTGPVESLSRLQDAAERRHAGDARR